MTKIGLALWTAYVRVDGTTVLSAFAFRVFVNELVSHYNGNVSIECSLFEPTIASTEQKPDITLTGLLMTSESASLYAHRI